MKIDFEHLGGIDKGSIELNDFTIFCGKNNSGKTYAMYSIYGLLSKRYNIKFDFVQSIFNKLKTLEDYESLDLSEIIYENRDEIVNGIEKGFTEYLPELFGVSNELFLKTKIKINFSLYTQKEIKKSIENDGRMVIAGIIFNNGKVRLPSSDEQEAVKKVKGFELYSIENELSTKYNIFQSILSERLASILFFNTYQFQDQGITLLPSERDGVNLFFRELFSIRNLLLQQSQNDSVNPMFFLKDIVKARYADPIKDYLQYLSLIGSTKKGISDYQEYAQIIQKNVLGGKYEVDDFGNVLFMPSESKNKLPLHFTSSTVKSLFGLVFYLKHLAKEGDYLMIDEPELNLHPDNQRQVARILAQLVNAGLKVIVSTHSDYFVRELNNLIMLKKGFSGAIELQKEYGYQENELLDDKCISAYLFDNKTITLMDLDDEGIIVDTFDKVINELNQSSNKIYFAMQDAKESSD